MFNGRGDHSVPDGAGQRRLGRGRPSALPVADAVVVAGEALDDEPLEAGGVPALGLQLAPLGCGDSLASARACLPRFARLHVRPGVGLSVARIIADGAPPVSAAVGACGAVPLPYPEPDLQGTDTAGAVELTPASSAVALDSAESRAAPTASAVPEPRPEPRPDAGAAARRGGAARVAAGRRRAAPREDGVVTREDKVARALRSRTRSRRGQQRVHGPGDARVPGAVREK